MIVCITHCPSTRVPSGFFTVRLIDKSRVTVGPFLKLVIIGYLERREQKKGNHRMLDSNSQLCFQIKTSSGRRPYCFMKWLWANLMYRYKELYLKKIYKIFQKKLIWYLALRTWPFSPKTMITLWLPKKNAREAYASTCT